MFPENIVAEQLGRLLLSRMVLLDTNAQEKLLPFVLKPRGKVLLTTHLFRTHIKNAYSFTDGEDNTDNNLFTLSTFKTYLVPKLLQMFCIRDVSIRLVLLSHFNSFVHTFQIDDLKSQVLPELLVGIKDTNDHLVSATLKALANVVPILGAATVIGGNRGKLFTDGRPNKVNENGQSNNITIAPPSFTNIVEFTVPVDVSEATVELPERPSPDGGEDKKEIVSSITEEEYTWSDWDTQETKETNGDIHGRVSRPPQSICHSDRMSTANSTSTTEADSVLTNCTDKAQTIHSNVLKKSIVLSDISQLDIKNSKFSDSTKEEYDFFTDMEPVIKKTQILHVQQLQTLQKSVFDVKVLNGPEGTEENDGWDEDLSEWGTEDAQH